jgi:hypothetical protein
MSLANAAPKQHFPPQFRKPECLKNADDSNDGNLPDNGHPEAIPSQAPQSDAVGLGNHGGPNYLRSPGALYLE